MDFALEGFIAKVGIGHRAPSGGRNRYTSAFGQGCGLRRIERPERGQAVRAGPRKRGLKEDVGERGTLADHVLDRRCQADAAHLQWAADCSCIWTGEGRLNVVVVPDFPGESRERRRPPEACGHRGGPADTNRSVVGDPHRCW